MSLTTEQLNELKRLAAEVAVREGCILYDVEFAGHSRTLKVFIDKDNGVGVDDCANVSRGINLHLDVNDLIPGGAYDLEVSSPGLERRLTQAWHFAKAIGQTVQLRYRDEKGVGTSYEGILQDVRGDTMVFENSKGTKELDLGAIEKAKVLFVVPEKEKPGKKGLGKKR